MKMTVQNISTLALSTDIGHLEPGEVLVNEYSPEDAYGVGMSLKRFVDYGYLTVTTEEGDTSLAETSGSRDGGAVMITNAYVMQAGPPATACSAGYFGISNVEWSTNKFVVTIPGEYYEEDLCIITNSYGNFQDIVSNLYSSTSGGETFIDVTCYRPETTTKVQGSFTITVFLAVPPPQ